jgi:mono/diheme cytochrome c family protein
MRSPVWRAPRVRGALAATVLIGLAGVGVGLRGQGLDDQWTVPPNAARRLNPLVNRSETEAGGRKLFQQRCATCHGKDGRGSSKAPDLTRAEVQLQTDGALFWKISGGNPRLGMPTFSFLPEAQRWQLVLHLRVLAMADDANRTGSSMR